MAAFQSERAGPAALGHRLRSTGRTKAWNSNQAGVELDTPRCEEEPPSFAVKAFEGVNLRAQQRGARQADLPAHSLRGALERSRRKQLHANNLILADRQVVAPVT